jgi:hypothetical protein
MKMVGKPDAGKLHVRFEEGGGSQGPSLLDESGVRSRESRDRRREARSLVIVIVIVRRLPQDSFVLRLVRA